MANADLSRCVRERLADTPDLSASGNKEGGGRFEEYAPRDCEPTGLHECKTIRLKPHHDVLDGDDLFREYAPPAR